MQSTLAVAVGWQLGSILYEINALPWVYDPAATTGDTSLGSFATSHRANATD